VEPDLETICLKCLAKEPERRYPSAEAMAEDLERRQRREPIQARPVGAWERLSLWRKRNPVIAASTATAACLLILGTVISSYFAVQANHQAEIATGEQKKAEASEFVARTEKARADKNAELAEEKASIAEKSARDSAEARKLAELRLYVGMALERGPRPVPTAPWRTGIGDGEKQ
jgi:eukaryotic-like serine/threonine-protein kinase